MHSCGCCSVWIARTRHTTHQLCRRRWKCSVVSSSARVLRPVLGLSCRRQRTVHIEQVRFLLSDRVPCTIYSATSSAPPHHAPPTRSSRRPPTHLLMSQHHTGRPKGVARSAVAPHRAKGCYQRRVRHESLVLRCGEAGRVTLAAKRGPSSSASDSGSGSGSGTDRSGRRSMPTLAAATNSKTRCMTSSSAT